MNEPGLQKFWRELSGEPLASRIANVDARLSSIDADGAFLPVVVHSRRRDQSNICSLRTHYIDYAREELLRLPSLHRALRTAARAGISALERVADACPLEDVVTINNLLFTTCLYPPLPAGAAAEASARLCAEFPDRAVIWRCATKEINSALVAELCAAGAVLLPWRSVHLSSRESLHTAVRESRDVRRDVALARNPHEGYHWSEGDEFSEADWSRAAALFHQLYLEKYSRHNPGYSADFFRKTHEAGAVRVFGLRAPSSALDGMVGIYRRDGVQAAPFLGYDTALSKKLGLYRMLCAKHWLEADEAGCMAHQSAGVATFKKNRRAQTAVEYAAVSFDHLPLKRRLAWRAFIAAIRHIALPITRRYER